MENKDIISKTVKYTAVFFIGYYLGGGCEQKNSKNPKLYSEPARIENNDNRINDLEKKIEFLENTKNKEIGGKDGR